MMREQTVNGHVIKEKVKSDLKMLQYLINRGRSGGKNGNRKNDGKEKGACDVGKSRMEQDIERVGWSEPLSHAVFAAGCLVFVLPFPPTSLHSFSSISLPRPFFLKNKYQLYFENI